MKWIYRIMTRNVFENVLLFFGNMLLYATRAALPLSIAELSAEFGWTKGESGVALSSFFWGYTMTQLVAGILADRYTGQLVIAYSSLCWALLTFSMPLTMACLKTYVDPMLLLVVFRISIGCCQGFFYPSVSSIFGHSQQKEKNSFNYAFVMSGSYSGTVLCGCLGSLVLTFGWQWVFYMFGSMTILWLALFEFYFSLRSNHLKKIREPGGAMLPPPAVVGVVQYKDSGGLLRLFREPAFWAMIFAYLCQNCSFAILFSWLPTYFKDIHPGSPAYLVNMLPWLVAVPVTMVGGVVCDHLRAFRSLTAVRKMAAFVSLVCSGVFLGIMPFAAHSLALSLACLMCALSCYSLNSVGLMMNPQDICPDQAGAVFGIMNTVGAVPGFAGVYIVGNFLQTSGNDWNAVFVDSALISFLGYIVFGIFGTARQI